VQFSPVDANLLLVGAWDATARVYDVSANAPRAKFDHRAPVLAGCWHSAGHSAYVGGLENQVRE
jgi:cell cycle arrest protein BUB3